MVTVRRTSLAPRVQRLSLSQDTRKPSGLGKRHIQAIMAFLGTALAYSMRINLSVTIVAMTASLNNDFMVLDWDISEQSIILGSFYIGYMILNIPGGHLSRVFGPKYLLSGAIFVSSAITLLSPYLANNYSWVVFCCSRVAIGLSQGFCYPTINTLMSKWAPLQERSRLVSCVYIGGQFGSMVTLFVSGYMAASPWGWPSVFYSIGLCGVLWCVVWLFVGADSPDTHPSISDAERDYIKASLPNSSDLCKVMPTPWKQIASSRPFLALLFVHVNQNWGYTVLLTMLPNYLNHILHFNISTDGLISSFIYLLMCALTVIFSWITDYWVDKRLLNLTLIRKIWNTLAHWGAAAALVLMTFTTSSRAATLALLTIATALNAGSYVGYFANHLDLAPNFAGLLMGITNGLANITSFLGPFVTGYIVTDDTNREQWMASFYICSATYFLGNLIFILFGSAEVQSWNDPIKEEEKSTEAMKYCEYISSI